MLANHNFDYLCINNLTTSFVSAWTERYQRDIGAGKHTEFFQFRR